MEMETVTVDTTALECSICYKPLKPHIFQCAQGHMVCSLCHDQLKDTGKCCYCGPIAGGMEHLVESLRVPCPHEAYGCHARPAYSALKDHLLACAHAPCHCPGGEACGFVGSMAALLDHVAGSAHDWPLEVVPACMRRAFTVRLRDGFNLLPVSAVKGGGCEHLLLLNVACRPFCRTVSVICIRPRASATAGAAKELRLKLHYSRDYHGGTDGLIGHSTTEFTVASSDLSGGLPNPNQCYQVVVPRYDHEDEAGRDCPQLSFWCLIKAC